MLLQTCTLALKTRGLPVSYDAGPFPVQVALAVDEHDGKRDKQQQTRHDDGVQAHALNTPVAQHGAKHKGKDHAKVQQAVFQKAAPVGDDVIVHVLQRVAQVADTHGRSDAVTVDLAEALDLHTAGKRGCNRHRG